MTTKGMILSFLLLLAGLDLRAEYFEIRDYKVDITVTGHKATFEVREQITVEFSEPRRGIFRNIPVNYIINGEKVTLSVTGVTVQGFNYKAYRENNDFVIRIGDPDVYVSGVQTYDIRYTVKGAFILAPEHTEFYWNIIGDSWKVPIDTVTYSVKLDKPIAMAENDYHIYTGARGQQGSDATVEYYLGSFTGHSTRKLDPGEGMTLAIRLPADYVRRPGKWELLWKKYGSMGIGSLLFLIISGLFYRTWSKYGKDYPIVRMVQYMPPKELTPSEAGVIIDEKADNVDILCLLPYWAHRGHLIIKRLPKTWGKDDHELTKVSNLGPDATPYERIVFDGLFADGEKVLISSLENEFYQHLSSAKTSLKTHLNSMGVYYPVSVKLQIYVAVISGILALAGVFIAVVTGMVAVGIGLGLAAVLGMIFASLMLKKNEKGVHLYQQVLGFKMFVQAAEKDKLERLLKDDPDYFEKTLPYAMVFGYAKQWSKKFDGLLTEPPKWYVAPHGMYYHGNTFSAADFGASFDSGVREIQSVFSSTPSGGSGGGSFSGGGSSGGGFGGGGGGSW